MPIRYQDNCDNILWEDVRLLLKKVGMSYTDADRMNDEDFVSNE